MDRRLTLAAAVVLALGAAVAVMLISPPDTGPEPSPPVEPVSVEVAPPVRLVAEPPAEAPATGPDGQSVAPQPVRTQGLPPRPVPQPPLDDADRWTEVRAEADRRWRESSMDIAETFAEQHHLSDAERDAVLSTLEIMHADLAAVRRDVEDGVYHPKQGRQEMEMIRGQALQDLIEEIGSDRTKALQVELDAQPGGGFGPVGE